jgi:hypothetical protein
MHTNVVLCGDRTRGLLLNSHITSIQFTIPNRASTLAIHTYHSCFIPKGVAEASQIFLRDTHVLPRLVMRNTADVTGGKPIAV